MANAIGADWTQEAHAPADSLLAIQAVQSPSWLRRMAAITAIVFLSLPILILFVPWQQNIRGTGRVVAFAPLDRQQNVEAPIGGRVVRWWVREGSIVAAGAPLLEISDIDPNLTTRLAQEQNAIQSKLDAYLEKVSSYGQQVENLVATRDLAVSAASHRVEMSREKVKAAAAALEAAQAATKAAEAQFERTRNLLVDGIVSQREFDVAERDLEMARSTTNSMDAGLKSAHNELKATEAELERLRAESESKINSARAALNDAQGEAQEVQAGLARIDVTVSRQQSQRVFAPRDGVVLRLIVSQDGEMVKQGDPLLILIPQTKDRVVELWVDGNDAPLITEGSQVRLQFEGWPAVQFVGWPSVAVGTFGGKVGLIDSTDDGNGKFRALVIPDLADQDWPDVRYLRQGVRAKGWVLLNRVSMGYEIWRQLNGFPPIVAAKEPKPGSNGENAK